MSQFYEFYTHSGNTLLFIILAAILVLIYWIGFVRLNVSWHEYDYSEKIIAELILTAFISAPYLSAFTKITKNPTVYKLWANVNDNKIISLLIYGLIATIIIRLAIIRLIGNWYDIQHDKTKKRLSLISLAISTIIITITTFMFMNGNIPAHYINTITTIATPFVINIVTYKIAKNIH